MKETIDGLFNELKEIEERRTILQNAIKSLQQVCSHEYSEIGNTSHATVYECKFCRNKNHV